MKPGTAWIKNQWKPIYSARKLVRGKKKGMVEVTYRQYRIKKAILQTKDIRVYPEGEV